MITFTARRYDGETEEFGTLAEADAFVVCDPETGAPGECGMFALDTVSPCPTCDGRPCTHTVTEARMARQ